MSTREEVREHFIKKFSAVYGPPKTPDFKGLVLEYERILSGYPVDVMPTAYDRVLKSHTYQNWPTIGECVEALQWALEQRDAKLAAENAYREQYTAKVPNSQEKKDAANNLVRETVSGWKKKEQEQIDARARAADASIDWSRISKPAWEQRMRENPYARWLSLPKGVREDIERLWREDQAQRTEREHRRRLRSDVPLISEDT